jgi:pimeloyl-ACP methyl ester carboxylesterase
MASEPKLWSETRGEGDSLLVYLHGLNATGAVWERIDELAATGWQGRRLIVDLPGHGRSPHSTTYSFGGMAAQVAAAIGDCESVTVVGHSMGGVVSLVLASRWFGLPIAGALAFGIKVSWSEEELARALAVSERPAKEFTDRAEAAQRFLRLSGLNGLVDPIDPIVDTGIRELPDGRVRLAADPRTAAMGAPAMGSLMAARQVPVRMACGSQDVLVGVDELRRFDPDAEEWEGLGHSAHVEGPEVVWRTVESFRDVKQ